ncbi:hypothetical protein [Halobiforma nitratireducens]|nr:hypothetical protein [Halobiforma nitratireducens]
MSEQEPTETRQSPRACDRNDRLEEATDSDVANAIAELESSDPDDE